MQNLCQDLFVLILENLCEICKKHNNVDEPQYNIKYNLKNLYLSYKNVIFSNLTFCFPRGVHYKTICIRKINSPYCFEFSVIMHKKLLITNYVYFQNDHEPLFKNEKHDILVNLFHPFHECLTGKTLIFKNEITLPCPI